MDWPPRSRTTAATCCRDRRCDGPGAQRVIGKCDGLTSALEDERGYVLQEFVGATAPGARRVIVKCDGLASALEDDRGYLIY